MPIPVNFNINPNKPTKILLHLMLSIGGFETKYNSCLTVSFKQSMIKARLLRGNLDKTLCEESAETLLVEEESFGSVLFFANFVRKNEGLHVEYRPCNR